MNFRGPSSIRYIEFSLYSSVKNNRRRRYLPPGLDVPRVHLLIKFSNLQRALYTAKGFHANLVTTSKSATFLPVDMEL